MRSVVVVLPASIWATMPMFRRLSSPIVGATITAPMRLPAIVRERLVRLGHAVRVLALLYGAALSVARVQDLGDELIRHRPLVFALPRVVHQPAQPQRRAPLLAHLNRHLVRCPAHAAGAHLEDRHDVVQGLVEDLDRVLPAALPYLVERAVDDALGEVLLPAQHDRVHEAVHHDAVVHRIGHGLAPCDGSLPRHDGSSSPLLGPLGPVLRASLTPVGHARGVDRPADDVIADAWQIRHAAAADEHDGVLLEVVADARDVRGDLVLVRQPHAGDLPQGRVRLLGGHRLDLDADPPPLRVPLQVRRLALGPQGATPPAHELIDCRHSRPPLLGRNPARVYPTPVTTDREHGRDAAARLSAPGYRYSNLSSVALRHTRHRRIGVLRRI